MEKKLARIGVPIARHVFLEEDMTANQLKLFVGLQYVASRLPDITEGENANITTLPEYKDDPLPPLWKHLKVTNWKDFLKDIGFETGHPERLKEDLRKLTSVGIPPYKIMIDGESYTVRESGVGVIRTKEVKHDKSGRLKEFTIMVGGYEPILKNWWQAISPKFLDYKGDIGVPAWRFIIQLGGAIRSQLRAIKDYREKYGSLPKFKIFLMNMPELEKKMRIADQNNERKAKAWIEVFTMMGVAGVVLTDMLHFSPNKIKAYELREFFDKQRTLWLRSKGFDERRRLPKDFLREHEIRRNRMKSKCGENNMGFLLTKEMLLEWLPLGKQD